jgi:AcrR family transcriptional regulator
MPHLLDTGDRVDHLVNATIYLINAEGVQAFTIRRLAAVARVSTSAITSHLENKWRMTDLFTKRIALRLHDAIKDKAWMEGVLAFVPDDDLLPLVRTWLAMCELARSDDGLGDGVAYAQEALLDLLHQTCRLGQADVGSDEDVVLQTLHSLVVGIWTARCARGGAMAREQAADVLQHACASLGVSIGPQV